jgi:hypothetical protein
LDDAFARGYLKGMTAYPKYERGAFRTHDLVPGDRHELSRGNAIYCAPTGGSGARGVGYGFELIDSDPAVDSAGVDAGFTPSDDTLRAPDVSVGVPDQPGWIPGAPPLALEYAGSGQNEEGLQTKIRELLEAGTRWVWVVRLVGPRRVEVYESGKPTVVKSYGDELTAPGVLQNSILAQALWDRKAAHEGTLRNLLQRAGYASIDAVREEGHSEGRNLALVEALFTVLSARGWTLTEVQRQRVITSHDPVEVTAWLTRAATASSLEAVFV